MDRLICTLSLSGAFGRPKSLNDWTTASLTKLRSWGKFLAPNTGASPDGNRGLRRVCRAVSFQGVRPHGHYAMYYRPVLTNRIFSPGVLYSAIDWQSLRKVVEAFDRRIREWYVQPARALESTSGHYAFAVMALNCLLIDTLSQFFSGEPESKRSVFLSFVRSKLPAFSQTLSVPIKRLAGRNRNPATLDDVAQVLYFGFRCGILHEAHVPLYGAISGLPTPVQVEAAGNAQYADGSDCPTVIVDPHQLLDALDRVLEQYISDLLNSDPAHNDLRAAFKAKFASSFGVDLASAT